MSGSGPGWNAITYWPWTSTCGDRDRVPAVLAALGERCGRPLSLTPHYFARRADGSAVVIGCRPAERRKPQDIEKFDATGRACVLAGWENRLAGATDPVVTANLRWLADYRHPRHRVSATTAALRRGRDCPFLLNLVRGPTR